MAGRLRRIFLLPLLALLAAPAAGQTRAGGEPPCVLRAELAGVISAGAASYLGDAVAAAEREGCQALLVVLDTPGGQLDATREVARAFLGADVPVVVYVAPSGARAGSAGVFVTMAAHVAAMAPGTNIGAAHPITAGGEDPEEAGGEHLARKIENDTAAFARAIAQRRGRNAEWAEAAVRRSISATAAEAVEAGVVDLVASSEAELLSVLSGKTVQGVTIATRGAPIVSFEPTIQQKALSILGDPNVAYVLLIAGFLGLVFELYQPGLIVPGAVGLFCLLLAGIGLNALPVQIGGIVLVAIAVALFVAELYVASYGLLTLGGVAALVIGSALLIDTHDPEFFAEPSVRVSWALIVPLASVLGLAAGLLAWNAGRLRHRRPSTGREGLVGERGRAEGGVGPGGGHVRIHGERWNAVSRVPVGDGEPVEVVGVEDLRLRVRSALPREEPA